MSAGRDLTSTGHPDRLIAADDSLIGSAHAGAAPSSNDRHAVVEDLLVQIALGANVDAFLARAILEAQLVEALAAGRAARPEPAARLVLGQLEGRTQGGVERRPEDEGLVDVAAEEEDEDLHSDARQELEAPARARPRLHDAQPARAVLVALTFAIPVKLNFDSAEIVGVDLLVVGADYDRRLEALLIGRQLGAGAKRNVGGGAHQRVLVDVRFAWLRLDSHVGHLARVLDLDHDITTVVDVEGGLAEHECRTRM